MKKLLFFVILGGFTVACSPGPYKMSATDKEAQRGFHHNEAKRIVDANEKNKQRNAKAAAKEKERLNEELNALNKNKPKDGTLTRDRIFKFY